MHYCKEVSEKISLYRDCTNEVLREMLSDRVTDNELIYIELLILRRYIDSLESDSVPISHQKSTTT